MQTNCVYLNAIDNCPLDGYLQVFHLFISEFLILTNTTTCTYISGFSFEPVVIFYWLSH